MICQIRVLYWKQQELTLVNLTNGELHEIFSCEVGEPGLGAGRKQSSLEDLEAGTTAESSWQGASGQDTAVGSVNLNCIFVLEHLEDFYFHIKKYAQIGTKLGPERESRYSIVCLYYGESCFWGNILQRLVRLKDYSGSDKVCKLIEAN